MTIDGTLPNHLPELRENIVDYTGWFHQPPQDDKLIYLLGNRGYHPNPLSRRRLTYPKLNSVRAPITRIMGVVAPPSFRDSFTVRITDTKLKRHPDNSIAQLLISFETHSHTYPDSLIGQI